MFRTNHLFELTPKLHAQGAFELGEDLLIGNAASGLVVVDHLRLLANLSCQILLRDAQGLTALLNQLSDVQSDSIVMQLLRLAVKLGGVESCSRVFVGGSVELLRSLDGDASTLRRVDRLLRLELRGLRRTLAENGHGVPIVRHVCLLLSFN